MRLGSDGPKEATLDECCKKEYKRPRKELLKQCEIRIQFFDSGCLIIVGCKSIAFNTAESAMDALNAYVKNPAEETEKWNEVFNKD